MSGYTGATGTSYFTLNGSDVYFLNKVSIGKTVAATAIDVSGTVTATAFSGSGSSLTALNATNLSSGTVSDVLLSANVVVLSGTQTLTGAKTFSAAITVKNAVFDNDSTSAYNIKIGSTAYAVTKGTYNLAIGANTLNGIVSGNFNSAIGVSSLRVLNDGTGNTAYGVSAGEDFTYACSGNTCIGFQSCGYVGGSPDSSGANYNTAIGYYSGVSNKTTASNNTFIGALADLSGGPFNNSTALGYNAKITASNQIVLGTATETITVPGKIINIGDFTISSTQSCIRFGRGTWNVTGNDNIGIGWDALSHITTGQRNIGVGSSALYTSTGTDNIAVGSQALYSASTGINNTAVGTSSLYASSTGSSNTAIGKSSGANGTGSNNTYLGATADMTGGPFSNSTAVGFNAKITASNQIVLGTSAETVVTGGLNIGTSKLRFANNNVVFVTAGAVSNYDETAGTNNVCIGLQPMASFIGAPDSNVAIGAAALYFASGQGTVALGSSAARNMKGNYNVAVGYQALYGGAYDSTTYTGIQNIAVGLNAGISCKNGSNNTFLGANTDIDISSNTYSGSTAIGYSTKITASNQIRLGTASETVVIGGTLMFNTSNLAIGGAFGPITTGIYNVGIEGALGGITTGSFNTGIGPAAGGVIKTGARNLCIGRDAMSYGTGDPSDGVAIGYGSQQCIASGSTNNISIGTNSLNGNGGGYGSYFLSGTNNTAIGDQSGASCSQASSNNTFLGANTNVANIATTYSGSTAVGYAASITASNQIVLGTASETVIIPGAITFASAPTINGSNITSLNGSNISSGTVADARLSSNIPLLNAATSNIFTGVVSVGGNLVFNTTVYGAKYDASNNIMLGKTDVSQTGTYNSALGVTAGTTNTTGSYNTFLGNSTDNSGGAFSYSTAVGYGSKITASNQIVLGTATESVYIPGRLMMKDSSKIYLTTNTTSHYLAYRTVLDGPELVGWSGGALAIVTDVLAKQDILTWSNTAVTVNRTLNTSDVSITGSVTASVNVIAKSQVIVSPGGGTTTSNGVIQVSSTASGALADGMAFRAASNANNIINFCNAGGTLRGYITGGASPASSVAYNTSSDERLKTDICTLGSQLANIKTLSARSFSWKENGENDFGFIAQEVYRVYPNLNPLKDNPKYEDKLYPTKSTGLPFIFGLDYGRMTPYLWKAAGELAELADVQQSQINTQQSQITSLQSQIDELRQMVLAMSNK